MAKAGRQTSKKRARQPRRQLHFTFEEVFPKDKADASRRWFADEKAALAAGQERDKQLDAARREIDRYLALRDNQVRPPWMDTPPQAVAQEATQEARGRTGEGLGLRRNRKTHQELH